MNSIEQETIADHIIRLSIPNNNLPQEQQHFLLQIDWSNEYLKHVPAKYQDFFLEVLPNLGVRTTDVHTAVCMGYLNEFVTGISSELNVAIDKDIVAYALILHDSGWGELSQEEVAQSLGVTGLKLTESAKGPKIKHAEEGKDLAEKLLTTSNKERVTKEQKALILDCVLYHDRPEKVAGGSMPAEVKAVVDLDHIWSFTRLNFWQDTARKGVEPAEYANNLERDLSTYFVTEFGKAKAQELLEERKKEVKQYQEGAQFVKLPTQE